MPAKNPRINITLEEETVALLSLLAKHEDKSVSTLSKELILEALDRREDMVLSSIAKIRDIKGAKKYKHNEVWE